LNYFAKFLGLFAQIDYEGRKRVSESYAFEETLIDIKRDQYVGKDERQLYIENLAPDTRYTFNISAKFTEGWGSPYSINVETSSQGLISYNNVICIY